MKYFSMILLGLLILTACGKDQQEIDDEIIRDYLSDNNLEAEYHGSGLYYQIINEGSGIRPDLMSDIKIRYKGYLINGNVFDETAEDGVYEEKLYNLISGWQIGVPLIKNGGEIILYLPSELGYGEGTFGIISPNSVLIFEIELLDSWH